MLDALYKLLVHFSLIASGDDKLYTFTVPKALMNFLGLNWFKGGMNLPLPDILKYTIYPAMYPIVMFYSAIFTTTASLKITSDDDLSFTVKINGFIVTFTFVAASCKILYFRFMRKDIVKIIKELEHLGHLDAEQPPVSEVIRSSIYYGVLLSSNAGTWAAYYFINYRAMPFITDYPWSQKNLYGWSGAYCVSFLDACYCAICHTLVDITFPTIVGAICGHLNVVKKNLSEIGSGYWTDVNNLDQAVDLHVKLLSITDNVVNCYSNLFVTQSVYTVLHACILIFAVVKVSDKIAVLWSAIPMLASAYAQLYMYCYYGQMLSSRFNDLSFASYDNKWYASSLKIRKGLVLFAESCKRPVGLKGFGSIHASLANYLHSIQESVSYFLILKTLTGDED